jgi:hypothetical protein
MRMILVWFLVILLVIFYPIYDFLRALTRWDWASLKDNDEEWFFCEEDHCDDGD